MAGFGSNGGNVSREINFFFEEKIKYLLAMSSKFLIFISLQDANESEAILKIKESMQEEAKRFEKDPDHPDYFMQ